MPALRIVEMKENSPDLSGKKLALNEWLSVLWGFTLGEAIFYYNLNRNETMSKIPQRIRMKVMITP